MFRKTLITVTIAAAAFFALGSPAPASADDFSCLFSPLGCDHGGIIDLGDSTDTTDAAGDTFIMPVLSPDVLAALTEPSIDIPEAALPNFELPGSIVPGPTDETPAEEPVAPVEESTATVDEPVAPVEESTATVDEPASGSPVVASSPSSFDEAAATTSTVATNDVEDGSTSDQVAEAATPISDTGADQGSSFSPMMAAVAGALGALAIVLLTMTAFATGRRRS